jgi:hypothetical protein
MPSPRSPYLADNAARAGKLTQDGFRPGFRHSHAFGMDILGERIIANSRFQPVSVWKRAKACCRHPKIYCVADE